MWIFLGFFGLREAAKKTIRHTFGNLESQKQVSFGYGVTNGRIEAAAIIDPLRPMKHDAAKFSFPNCLKKKSVELSYRRYVENGKKLFFTILQGCVRYRNGILGAGMDVVTNSPKCPVPVLMSYRTYRSVRYRY